MGEPNDNQRDSLGLNAAADGDMAGVAVFLDFVQRELYSMIHLSGVPEQIAPHVKEAQRRAELAHEFVAGFNAGRALKS